MPRQKISGLEIIGFLFLVGVIGVFAGITTIGAVITRALKLDSANIGGNFAVGLAAVSIPVLGLVVTANRARLAARSAWNMKRRRVANVLRTQRLRRLRAV